ncbi:uridine kinase family protein [Pelagibacterium sp.]|uniref:uridine kinase family protein n=1 Tax=Pelagibacterium sp. TaxID=1967288 RepID=UPI003A93A8E4
MARFWHDEVERVARHIRAIKTSAPRPLVAAVDGRSGVGKSSFSRELGSSHDAVIIDGDDFFAGGVFVRDDPAAALAETCIDWPAQRAVIEALLTEGRAQYFPFDWDRFDGSKSSELRIVAARPLIILEGVYSARPQLRDHIDLAVLIEVPPERRIAQLLKREGEIGPWEKQWHRAEDWYFAALMPREAFDIVI